jgi:STE24 endopeptidase
VRGREVGWPWVAVAFVVVVLGVAFGGLLASVATLAVLPARAETRALAREVAAREGVQLPFVLRLPTVGVRFANAAAVPWARTIVVADRMEQLLDRDALRAVLAHEAGHMSEGPQVAAARVGSVGILLFVVAVGPVVALTLPGAAGWAVLAAGALAGVLLLLTARRLARRMEKRADARAAETVGAAPLARALRALHANGQMPMVTGRRRVHPDLYDRLVALGEDVGPRPPPPPRGGTLLGVAIAITLVAAPVIVHAVTDVSADEVRNVRGSRAAWRLFVDPWDGEALLAAAWHARADGALDRAFELASFAERAGADAWSRHVLLSELHAATGECDAARAAFEASLAAQADRLFHQGLDGAHLELGAYALPPSLVRECDLTVGDAFGGDAHFRMPLE